ncbi:MAG: alpha/beta fold hydrolase [Clostridia bacterium]|nr:alpha/beta fold hydrolase [Clostridia bacterium]
MKKITAVLLCFLFLFAIAPGAGAVSLEDGGDALQAIFQKGSAAGLDYRYFEPELREGQTYPLVIFLHGIASGNSEGQQLRHYDFYKWASDEFQARFSDAGGAYLFFPRAPGGWEMITTGTLKKCIDSFLSAHADRIDKTRIYLIGFSVGASMTIHMVADYPQLFAAAVPISAVTQASGEIDKMAQTAVWFFANEKDIYAGATASATKKSFDRLRKKTENEDSVRFTRVTQALYPDYSKVSNQHYMWRAVSNDMFMDDRQPYGTSTTYNGAGEELTLTYPYGVISWLSAQTQQNEAKNSQSFFEKLAAFFRSIFSWLANLFS